MLSNYKRGDGAGRLPSHYSAIVTAGLLGHFRPRAVKHVGPRCLKGGGGVFSCVKWTSYAIRLFDASGPCDLLYKMPCDRITLYNRDMMEGEDLVLSLFLAMLETEEDRTRFTVLYEQCNERIEQNAMRLLKNQQDAEDAVQNTYIQIIRHFEKVYEIPCDELPYWCISIVKNEAYMILRKKQKTIPFEDWDAVTEDIDLISGYEDIVNLFRQIPETYRAALEMKLLLDYSGKEIAQHLGISESAANTRVSRGCILLRELAEKEGFHV